MLITVNNPPTSFHQVAVMNEAFGNPEGDFKNIDPKRILSQSKNIFDEYLELLGAFGVGKLARASLKGLHDEIMSVHGYDEQSMNVPEVRDALCDIQVFAMGAQHLMGVDGDADMTAVVEGVMTRFIKSKEDKAATVAMHAAKGVTDVVFSGGYPTVVMKSASDQPDAPKGKFLKSASYSTTVWPDPLAMKVLLKYNVPFMTAVKAAQNYKVADLPSAEVAAEYGLFKVDVKSIPEYLSDKYCDLT